jgi:DNA polymerase
MWRDAHPATVAFWKDVETQAKNAVTNPNAIFTTDKLKFVCKGGWLYIRLPSGRVLSYPNTQINDDGQLSYMGINQYSRKWQRLKTYSGKIVENVTQALSRDVLAYNMPDIEAAGYEIVLSIHDEFITEVPDSDRYSADRLSELMSANKPWSTGLPLAAAGFESLRYRKG